MWIEVVFWGLIIVFALIGLWKGLFDSLLSLLGTGVAVGVSIWLAKPAAAFINKLVNVPDMFEKLLDKVFENSQSIEIWGNVFEKADLAAFLSLLFAGVVVYILIKLAIWLLAKLFDGVTRNSTIASGLNRLFGLVFGIVKGGFIICVLLAICSILSETQIFGNTIDNAIDKAPTTKWVYNYVDQFTEDTLNKVDMKEFLKNLVSNANEDETTPETETNALPYEISIEVPNHLVD